MPNIQSPSHLWRAFLFPFVFPVVIRIALKFLSFAAQVLPFGKDLGWAPFFLLHLINEFAE